MPAGKVTRGGGQGHEEFTPATVDLPPGGDFALVGDGGESGGLSVGDGEDDSWDLPEGGKAPAQREAPIRQQQNGGGGDERTHQQEGFDEEDARLAYSDEEPPGQQERNSKRARRNANRKAINQAAQAEIHGLRQQLEELGGVVRTLATGQSHLAVNTIEGQINSLEGSLRIADEEMATAVKNSDGDTYARAQKIRDTIVGRLYGLRDQHTRLAAAGGQIEEQMPQGRAAAPQGQRQPSPDPAIVAAVEDHFERFNERFPWFDPTSQDADANIVRAVQRELVSKGHQMHTPVFWTQMERRLADYGFQANREGGDEGEFEERPQRRGPPSVNTQRRPPTGSGRSTQNGRGTGFSLDETQTSMLRDEGLLEEKLSEEDTAKRDRIIAKWRRGADQMRRQGAR